MNPLALLLMLANPAGVILAFVFFVAAAALNAWTLILYAYFATVIGAYLYLRHRRAFFIYLTILALALAGHWYAGIFLYPHEVIYYALIH